MSRAVARTAPFESARDERGDRLWGALSRPFERQPPPKGADVFGEWLAGVAARTRSERRLRRRAERVIAHARELRGLSERAFDERIEEAGARARLHRDAAETVDLAYAVGHEAVRRTLGLELYPEQVTGALGMADGCCVEMATGEGKTVTAILPAALDGWSGRGVHVVTVNDYLAKRDAELTSAAYRRLGLTTGALHDDMAAQERQEVYLSSIVYGADKQFIFDFLRDRLVAPLKPTLTGHLLDALVATERLRPQARGDWSWRVVQRGLHAAIIDEADSVLIDEAVTPAIIASREVDERDGPWAGAQHYLVAARIAGELESGSDYRVDARRREAQLSASGRARLASMAKELPPFWAGPRRREELVKQALLAKELFRRDDDYILRESEDQREVVIVDRSTGRILEGRQWQLGLHQAVEAKEGITPTGSRLTTARISYQRFFQRYRRLSGMSGTAWETRHELYRDYRLPVIRIPTHRKVIRRELPDSIAATEAEKFDRVAERVVRLHRLRRPVLVGTRSVAASERLGTLLEERGIRCRILNATREREEAEIVALAGKPAAVTVATNMAGRGTDILLTPETREMGGLVVLATERHSERRVDRQLFGRAGRQGDPGEARAFVSLEDAVIRQFGFGPLAVMCRRSPGPVRRLIGLLLWRMAQHLAARRAVTLRREVAKQESFLDMAMHHESR